MEPIIYGILILNIILVLLVVLLLLKNKAPSINAELREYRQDLANQMGTLLNSVLGSQRQFTELTGSRIDDLIKNNNNAQTVLNTNVSEMSANNERRFKQFLESVETRLKSIQEDNEKQLNEMRQTVDKKLHETLETRIGQAFTQVSERLEQVYHGLGEMQNLAIGVGDLKKVLSNVKNRGILGEIQLGAILEQILSKEQYETNIVTKKSSNCPIEYAVKMPGDDNSYVYLPIDSKFPLDAYSALVEAQDNSDKNQVDTAIKVLKQRIKSFAKDIKEKYIDPPNTTDFAIMFLPYEGLYAEVIRHGLVEELSREFKIIIAGPTTMAALLNSLQMGFKTLAIQKRSSEVWTVLSAVKTEFDKFGEVLKATQTRLDQANTELDKLVGVRTRVIQRRLRNLDILPEEDVEMILIAESNPDEDIS